ncbi:sensor histidine kinase [Natronococcus amylolyticus]|nr:ATP-binding protein [Natronococcus amylolyticus]
MSGTHPADVGVEPPVSHPRRRILRLLRSRDEPLSVTDLATRLATRTPSCELEDRICERMRVALVHVYLPKLADSGLVEWNRERRVVRATDARECNDDTGYDTDRDHGQSCDGRRLGAWLCCPSCGRRNVTRGRVDAGLELECHDCGRGETLSLERRPEGQSGDSESNPSMGDDKNARERALEASNERLEQFAYAASHDLQEPLRMVSGYLQLIEGRYEGELDADGEEFLAYAVDGADRMREMIDGLLAYSRIETQGTAFEPVALEAVLEDVCKDLEVRIEETDADVTIGSLPRVEGDETQLRQLFQNLVSNALEYSGDDRPIVRIEAERDGSEWLVAVRDEGIGIEPTNQERIFDVFERLHGYHERRGTGIGLAICERIAERHGGEIRVDSEPGEGSAFVLTLPAPGCRP